MKRTSLVTHSSPVIPAAGHCFWQVINASELVHEGALALIREHLADFSPSNSWRAVDRSTLRDDPLALIAPANTHLADIATAR